MFALLTFRQGSATLHLESGVGDMNDHAAFYKRVGELIRAKRQEQGLSQDMLAKAVGLKRPTVSNIEKGRQNILLHTFFDIAETLGTTADALLRKQEITESSSQPNLDAFPNDVRGFVEAAIAQSPKRN